MSNKLPTLDEFSTRLLGRAKSAIASDSEYDEFVVIADAADAAALVSLLEHRASLLRRVGELEGALRNLLRLEAVRDDDDHELMAAREAARKALKERT